VTSGLLLRGGVIHTLEPGCDRPVTALAIAGGKVVAAGSQAQAEAALRGRYRTVNLDGACVVPGFTDCHAHFAAFASGLAGLRLEDARSPEEVGRRVAAAAAARPGAWVVGSGWNRNLWQGGGHPHRKYLDVAACPVALTSKDGHALWANSLALRLAGVDRDTPDPAGGRIEREADGEPTGLLLENAVSLVSRLVPAPGIEEAADAVRQGLKLAHARGLTGVHVPEGAESLRVFQHLRRAGELTLRVHFMLPQDRLEALASLGLEAGLGDRWLSLGHLKFFLDGALGQRTADMLEPYEGEEDYRGVPVMERAELSARVRAAVEAGWPCAVHAIGDRANRVCLDVFEEHLEASRRRGLRHRVEHAQCLHPDDVARFARLGVVASVQPIHATSDRYLADRHWGRRARRAYPFRSLLDAGAVLAMGSDAPVEPLDPLRGMYAAVTRKREDEPEVPPWYPEECIGVREALEGFTRAAAYAAGEEGRRGTLAPGAPADLVVLSHDILRGPPEWLLEAQVTATLVEGRPVHGELP